MIQQVKRSEGSYIMWDDKTGTTVDINKIFEYNAFGKPPVRYRVDMGGVTIGTMLPLGEAKKLARKNLKKESK